MFVSNTLVKNKQIIKINNLTNLIKNKIERDCLNEIKLRNDTILIYPL